MRVSRARRVPAAVVCLLLVCLTASACTRASSDGERSPETPSLPHRTIALPPEEPPPPGVHLSFIQQRLDEGTRRANITVANGTGKVLRVRSVGLDWPGYPGQPSRLAYAVPAQATIDLAYQLPRANCSPEAGEAPAFAIVSTASRTAVRRALADEGVRFLTRLWRTECDTRRLRRAVSVDYSDPAGWSETGTGPEAVLDADLVVRRRGGDAVVAVDQVQGSVLFDLALGEPRSLESDARTLETPLAIGPGRCDEHARGQSQQTFVWRVWLTLDGGPPIATILPPDREGQAKLLAFLDRVCAS